MHHTKGGFLGNLIHKIFLNIHIIVLVLLIVLFSFNIIFYNKKNEQQFETDVLLDKTYENINEIYINNEFGKSFILKTPTRSRIIVQKKEIGNTNTFIIKIDVIQ